MRHANLEARRGVPIGRSCTPKYKGYVTKFTQVTPTVGQWPYLEQCEKAGDSGTAAFECALLDLHLDFGRGLGSCEGLGRIKFGRNFGANRTNRTNGKEVVGMHYGLAGESSAEFQPQVAALSEYGERRDGARQREEEHAPVSPETLYLRCTPERAAGNARLVVQAGTGGSVCLRNK